MKRGSKGSKLYVVLVTPGSSAGVKYRHGVTWMSFFSCDMWVPLWVTGVGSVHPVGQKYTVYQYVIYVSEVSDNFVFV